MRVLRYLRDAAVFAPCYVVLDWASYIDPFGPFNITPWNPQPALAIAWMLLGGLHHAPAVMATIFLADVVVRDAPGGYALGLLAAITLAAGYAGIAAALHRVLPERALRSTRQLTLFAAIVGCGSAIVGAAFVSLVYAAGLLGEGPVHAAWLRFWIGDAVGILVTAPLLLAVADPGGRSGFAVLARRPETALQVLALAATLWLIFRGLPGDPAYHFYLLFVPLIWIAARGGMTGAVVATAIVQLGVVAGIHRDVAAALPVLELQALVAALTLTGLYLGMMVDERQRAAESLRQSLRLAAAGEMAGAIAHEVNQPLAALSNYGESALLLCAGGPGALERLPGVITKIMAEAERASEVVRRLRDFFRSGTTRLEVLSAAELAAAVRRIGTQVAGDVPLELREEPRLPALLVDRMQLEVVLRNLLANANDAVRAGATTGRRIGVELARRGENSVCVTVTDSGPGLAADMLERVFEPFFSGKATGLGLGLAICRAVAEAHGGSLEARAGPHGEFQLTLPCAQSS